jgi:hypothetical protein
MATDRCINNYSVMKVESITITFFYGSGSFQYIKLAFSVDLEWYIECQSKKSKIRKTL